MRELTEGEVCAVVLRILRGRTPPDGRVKLTYEHGPYDIDAPTSIALDLADAIQQKFREVNGLPAMRDAKDYRG